MAINYHNERLKYDGALNKLEALKEKKRQTIQALDIEIATEEAKVGAILDGMRAAMKDLNAEYNSQFNRWWGDLDL